MDVTGGISKTDDATVRIAPYEATNMMLTRAGQFSALKRWALELASDGRKDGTGGEAIAREA